MNVHKIWITGSTIEYGHGLTSSPKYRAREHSINWKLTYLKREYALRATERLKRLLSARMPSSIKY